MRFGSANSAAVVLCVCVVTDGMAMANGRMEFLSDQTTGSADTVTVTRYQND